MPINAATRYRVVYGHPVYNSASPAMQNAGIAALGPDWKYLAFDVQPDNLRQEIAGAKAMKFISDGGISTLFRHQPGRYSGAL
jgi:shikimate dehydrogenase